MPSSCSTKIQRSIFQEKSKAMLQIRFDETPYKKPVRVSNLFAKRFPLLKDFF